MALNGFFVAAEFALVAVRRTQVEEMVAQGRPRGRRPSRRRPRTSTAPSPPRSSASRWPASRLGCVGEPALARLIEPLFDAPAGRLAAASARTRVATALAFLLITFMHVVFGELIPKTVALQIAGHDGACGWPGRSTSSPG